MADNEIRPALTPKEWEQVRLENLSADDCVYADYEFGVAGIHKDQCLRVMALTHAELPDGHPNKITRDDVQRCLLAADRDEEAAAYMGSQGPSPWRTLASKLAALLPPENE